MNFIEAVRFLKQNKKVTRTKWIIKFGELNKEVILAEELGHRIIMKVVQKSDGEELIYCGPLDEITPIIEDVLANDWEVI